MFFTFYADIQILYTLKHFRDIRKMLYTHTHTSVPLYKICIIASVSKHLSTIFIAVSYISYVPLVLPSIDRQQASANTLIVRFSIHSKTSSSTATLKKRVNVYSRILSFLPRNRSKRPPVCARSKIKLPPARRES